ncbi:hypothetical protein [Sporosarcina sp. A2]|uniref:hypothetical protein n=1 Tax=Sporosarcina sp. A2 TaxID=3393449 RepID=UPI003D7961D7
MKKFFFVILFVIVGALAACSIGEEDKGQEYSGVIGMGSAMGYQYIVVKEKNTTFWEVSYKGNPLLIEESSDNIDDLEEFMIHVNESQTKLVTVILWLSYFLIVALTALVLYIMKKEMLKGNGIIIILIASAVAVYFALQSAIDLNSLLQEVKYLYLRLIS